MKYPFLALLLSLAALPSAAQETDDAFLDRVFEAADPTSETRVPVLCGGLYQSLAVVFADDAQSVAVFRERQDVARNMAVVVHIMESEQFDMEVEVAGAFADTRFTGVADIFNEWVAFNQANGLDRISDGISQAYQFCGTQHVDWTSVPGAE